MRAVKPTVLIGTIGEPGSFAEAVVREMARHVDAPADPAALEPDQPAARRSRPTSRLDRGARAGRGRQPVRSGRLSTGGASAIGQGNNVFIFPGVGLGAIVAEAREVTDGMFVAAADSLAASVTAADFATGSVFPPIRAHPRGDRAHRRRGRARGARGRCRAARAGRRRDRGGGRRRDVGAGLPADGTGLTRARDS